MNYYLFRMLKSTAIIVKAFVIIWFGFPLYVLSFIFPRDKDMWVFGCLAGQIYADNSKALFSWMLDNKHDQQNVYWITKRSDVLDKLRKEKKPCAHAYSIRGLYITLRASVYIYTHTSSDINFWVSGGACKVNLWHGSAIKKVSRDVQSQGSKDRQIYAATGFEKLRYRLLTPGYFEVPDLIFAASECVAKNLITSHGVSKDQITITGYPRNDALFTPAESIKARYNQPGRRIILYLPTFREHDDSDEALKELINIFGTRPEYLLAIKLHPATCQEAQPPLPPNVVLVDQSIDSYEMLSISDALITDYSSVALDYLLLDRPIIYFCYDYEAYISNEREFYYDFNDATGGPVVKSPSAVIEELDIVLHENLDHYEHKRRTVRRTFNQVVSNKNCANAYAIIKTR